MINKLRKLTNIFNNNTFLFIFSIFLALGIWFYMASENLFGRPRVVYDVPISINLSDEAQLESIRVFDQSVNTTSVSITGSSFIIDMVQIDDLSVVANLSPLIQKLTGKTMQKETINLVAYKTDNNALADYSVSGISPGTITVMYDRYKEQVFNIENQIKYSTDENFYVEQIHFSQNQVNISGPESSINKIARVVVDRDIDSALSSSMMFSSGFTLYDSNNNVLDTEDMFIEMDTQDVDVQINVLNKQEVTLNYSVLNMPSEFSENRIKIEPSTIDIAGALNVISDYRTITLPTAIDFSLINLEAINNDMIYEMDVPIPMPENVTNVSKVENATVTVNLSGYEEVIVPVDNFTFSNVTDGKTVTLVEKNTPVTIMVPSEFADDINPDTVYGTIDMAGLTAKNGNTIVPVKIGISGNNSAWTYGKYSIMVNVSDTLNVVSETNSSGS